HCLYQENAFDLKFFCADQFVESEFFFTQRQKKRVGIEQIEKCDGRQQHRSHTEDGLDTIDDGILDNEFFVQRHRQEHIEDGDGNDQSGKQDEVIPLFLLQTVQGQFQDHPKTPATGRRSSSPSTFRICRWNSSRVPVERSSRSSLPSLMNSRRLQ